jgi:hypothetical protein
MRGNRLAKSDSANVTWLSSLESGHLRVEFSRTVLLAGDATGRSQVVVRFKGTWARTLGVG